MSRFGSSIRSTNGGKGFEVTELAAAAALLGVLALALVGWVAVGRVRRSLQALRTENAGLRMHIGHLREALDGTRAQVQHAERRLDRYKGRMDRQSHRIKRVRTDLSLSVEEAAASAASASRDAARLEKRLETTRSQVSTQRERSEEVRQRVTAFRGEVATRQDGQSRLNAELRTGVAESRSTARQARTYAEKLAGRPIHGSMRFLGDDEFESLLHIAAELGLTWANDAQLRYMEHAVISLEARLRGRLAAPVEAMILRALIVMACESRDVKVLEIGTLHGLSAAYFHEVVSPQMQSFHQTIVDPFMGYYEEGAPDLFTPIPVRRSVAAENLARVGATPDHFEIVEGLSEDPDIRARLADHRFDVVVIDGDHSYDGVRRDFENYAGHVLPGGFIIIDDYRGPSWPDVTRYVDETVFTDERFEVVTGELRTAVVRRKR